MILDKAIDTVENFISMWANIGCITEEEEKEISEALTIIYAKARKEDY